MDASLSDGRTQDGHSIHRDTFCTLECRVWRDFQPAESFSQPISCSAEVDIGNRIFGTEADIDAVASAKYFSVEENEGQQHAFKYGTAT